MIDRSIIGRDLPAPPTFLFAAELDSHAAFSLLESLGVPLADILHGEQGFSRHKPVCAGDTVTVKPRVTDLYANKGGARCAKLEVSTANPYGQVKIAGEALVAIT